MEEKTSNTIKPINISEVFASKSPRLAKIIPGFIYRYINRILHIDYVNDLLKRSGHLTGIDFIDQAVAEFNITEHLHELENVPSKGRFIFASNHPLGGFDGLLLLRAVDKRLGNSKFLTNDILMNIPQLKPLFVPINKHGSHSRGAAKILNETYASDDQILIFPSGLASRKIKGKIVDLEWKKHFITKAVQYKRDIIPVFIDGRNSNRFYRLANWRKFFKIKWNLEMFFLPDETMKHRNSEINIYFGNPISYTMLNKSKTHDEWATYIKNIVYRLPKKDLPGN